MDRRPSALRRRTAHYESAPRSPHGVRPVPVELGRGWAASGPPFCCWLHLASCGNHLLAGGLANSEDRHATLCGIAHLGWHPASEVTEVRPTIAVGEDENSPEDEDDHQQRQRQNDGEHTKADRTLMARFVPDKLTKLTLISTTRCDLRHSAYSSMARRIASRESFGAALKRGSR